MYIYTIYTNICFSKVNKCLLLSPRNKKIRIFKRVVDKLTKHWNISYKRTCKYFHEHAPNDIQTCSCANVHMLKTSYKC